MTEPNQLSPTPPVDPAPPVDPSPPGDPAPPVDPERATEPFPAGAPAAPVEPPPPVATPAPPATDWREPPWFPPRDKDRHGGQANLGAIVVGLIILAVGIYFFLDRTLGLNLPRIQWGTIWPVLLIVLGGMVLLRSIQRR